MDGYSCCSVAATRECSAQVRLHSLLNQARPVVCCVLCLMVYDASARQAVHNRSTAAEVVGGHSAETVGDSGLSFGLSPPCVAGSRTRH